MRLSLQITLKTARPKGNYNTHWRLSKPSPSWLCCLLYHTQLSLIKLWSTYLWHRKGSSIHRRLAECASCHFIHNLVSNDVYLDYLLGQPKSGCKSRRLGFHTGICAPHMGTEQQPAWKQHLDLIAVLLSEESKWVQYPHVNLLFVATLWIPMASLAVSGALVRTHQ